MVIESEDIYSVLCKKCLSRWIELGCARTKCPKCCEEGINLDRFAYRLFGSMPADLIFVWEESEEIS